MSEERRQGILPPTPKELLEEVQNMLRKMKRDASFTAPELWSWKFHEKYSDWIEIVLAEIVTCLEFGSDEKE